MNGHGSLKGLVSCIRARCSKVGGILDLTASGLSKNGDNSVQKPEASLSFSNFKTLDESCDHSGQNCILLQFWAVTMIYLSTFYTKTGHITIIDAISTSGHRRALPARNNVMESGRATCRRHPHARLSGRPQPDSMDAMNRHQFSLMDLMHMPS